ncbi:hypothetical protein [Bacillus andreraoultii]|uniref:hypothetical protein n=1 Tax=Bacillus andreraoultii TaxID=1499685 RepID=UPI000539C3C0|nr:hypothetical protein [Bacillus andreraoultii]
MEKWFVRIVATVVVIYAAFQTVRPEAKVEISGEPKGYKSGNYPIQVFVDNSPLTVRSSPDLRAKDNEAGQLEKGDLFFIANEETLITQTATKWNLPRYNVIKYEIKQIELIQDGERQSRFVNSVESEHLTEEGEAPTDENRIRSDFGIFAKSLPLNDYIRSELIAAGWDGKVDHNFKSGNFRYIAEGFYGTILIQSVRMYDRKGKQIGTLPIGSQVFATMNLPFATGHEDPSKIRIVGFTKNGSNYVEKVGTYFIDGYANGRPTIETIMKRRE